MFQPKKRSYQSPARAQQADETKLRITDVAHALFSQGGYASTTIEDVAREAGVSVQTVYAVFGSKPGLVEAVIERVAFGPQYRALVKEALQAQDPVQRLRFAAAIARQIYDAERSVIDLIGGAGVVSPELATKMKTRELGRRTSQSHIVPILDEAGLLKPSLDAETGSDILWTLTGRDIYRMLVHDRGWSPEKYQEWVGDALVATLVA